MLSFLWVSSLSIFLLIVGLILLIKSSSIFIDYSSSLSKKLGLTELFVGMIVSSISTSLPEFFVSFLAAINREVDICLGNIFGTVMANIGLGFGLALLISHLKVDREYIYNCIFMIATSFIIFLLSFDGVISIKDGITLLFIFFIYLYISYKRRHKKNLSKKRKKIPIKIIAGIAISLIGIWIGAKIVIWSAVNVSTYFGISKLLIGTGIIAIGTSLPEISATAIAAYKKHPGLSIGIIIGSNIVDILFIIGFSSLFINIFVSRSIIFTDIPIFALISIILLIFMRTHFTLSKMEGIFLLSIYILYLLFHILL